MSHLQHQKHFWFEFVRCMDKGPSIGWTKGVACAFERNWNKRRSTIPYFAWPTRVRASPHETTRRIAVATSSLTQNYCILIGSRSTSCGAREIARSCVLLELRYSISCNKQCVLYCTGVLYWRTVHCTNIILYLGWSLTWTFDPNIQVGEIFPAFFTDHVCRIGPYVKRILGRCWCIVGHPPYKELCTVWWKMYQLY